MAVKLSPPPDADVVRVSIGARSYEAKGGTWTIDDDDADDLRRAGWRDAPAGGSQASSTPVVTPTPEASDANP